jgi:transposase
MGMPRKAEPSEGLRRLAVELVEDGEPPADVAERLDVTERSVWRWLKIWRRSHGGSLATRRRTGRPPKLTSRLGDRLLGWLDRSPCEFGFTTERWTSPRLSRVLQRETGVQINHRYLCDWLARHDITPQLPERVPQERDPAKIAAWAKNQWPLIKKDVIDRGATLGFTDESGFLLMPLICPTLAPRGHTPQLIHRARHRDKVSVAAALTLTPVRNRIGLHYQTYPNSYVNAETYAEFLRLSLLRNFRGPLVLVHDQGSMHKGPFVRELCSDFPRLKMHFLPGYAPQFNPAEPLWKHAKIDDLGNFAPLGVPDLDRAIHASLDAAGQDQNLLRSFFAATELSWKSLTRLF